MSNNLIYWLVSLMKRLMKLFELTKPPKSCYIALLHSRYFNVLMSHHFSSSTVSTWKLKLVKLGDEVQRRILKGNIVMSKSKKRNINIFERKKKNRKKTVLNEYFATVASTVKVVQTKITNNELALTRTITSHFWLIVTIQDFIRESMNWSHMLITHWRLLVDCGIIWTFLWALK